MANGNFAGGNGTESSPYLIEDADDLQAINDNLSAHYKLINDIDLGVAPYNKEGGWTPISTFTGAFDGDGHEIKNLFINRSSSSNQGLFGDTSTGAVIKNVGIVDADVTGGGCAGILVGKGERLSSVKSVHTSGNVVGTSQVGGLIGGTSGLGGRKIITNSYADASVRGDYEVGGLIGNLANGVPWEVDSCYSIGSVSSNGAAGGLAGRTYRDSVANSFWDIETSGQSYSGSSSYESGTGLTTSKMQDKQTYIDAGWDEDIWQFHPDNEDYPRLWFQEDWYKIKSFLKAGDTVYSLDEDGRLVSPQVSDIPTEQEFIDYGMDNLSGFFTPSNQVYLIMDRVGELDGGGTFSKKITPEEFSRQIRRIRNVKK